ncbi:hypothetical protein B296_00006857 [Ensete ventricosum]|uniref:Uncharacterized protein n=1 Tax=Ensete ventricosum TaxID=4639 RepID=A0A426ZGT2_ENSVE|nr:hypothetical protein B296_00006857 [Ensete ventricosum]
MGGTGPVSVVCWNVFDEHVRRSKTGGVNAREMDFESFPDFMKSGDMVKPVDPLRITLTDLLACKQGGTVVGMLMDVCGFWAHDNRENLLQEEEEE